MCGIGVMALHWEAFGLYIYDSALDERSKCNIRLDSTSLCCYALTHASRRWETVTLSVRLDQVCLAIQDVEFYSKIKLLYSKIHPN